MHDVSDCPVSRFVGVDGTLGKICFLEKPTNEPARVRQRKYILMVIDNEKLHKKDIRYTMYPFSSIFTILS